MENLPLKKGTVAVLPLFLSEHIMLKLVPLFTTHLHEGPLSWYVPKLIRKWGVRVGVGKDPGYYTGSNVLSASEKLKKNRENAH